MVASTRWSQEADANGLRGQFFNHCCEISSRCHISTIRHTWGGIPPILGQSLRTLARWTNRPSSPTTSSNGQNCTRGGPAMTTFFLVACRVNMTFVYFISNSVARICVSVLCLCPLRAVSSATFRTMGKMLAVFMQTQWSSKSRSTVNLEGSCAMLRIKSSA